VDYTVGGVMYKSHQLAWSKNAPNSDSFCCVPAKQCSFKFPAARTTFDVVFELCMFVICFVSGVV
jgi:hypothetical protein